MAKLVIPDLPPGSKVFWELDDGTVIELPVYSRRDGPGLQLGLKQSEREQAHVLGVRQHDHRK